jgi:hypothetical protein
MNFKKYIDQLRKAGLTYEDIETLFILKQKECEIYGV